MKLLILSLLMTIGMFSQKNEVITDYCSSVKSETTKRIIKDKTLGQLVKLNSNGTLEFRQDFLSKIGNEDKTDAVNQLEKLNANILNGVESSFVYNDLRLSSIAMGNCFCRDCPCASWMCCKRGFWIFCWNFGSC